jgi:methionyl-tRNA synthetase
LPKAASSTGARPIARTEYIQRNEPWKLVDEDPDRAAQVIRDCVQLVKAIGVLAAPVMPGTAARLWEQLGESGSIGEITLDAALEAPPETFDAPTELFERIEDDRVAELNEELQVRIEDATSEPGTEAASADADAQEGGEENVDTEAESAATAAEADLEPLIEERIGFEEFRDLDLRVGRIEHAEAIDGADELVRLEVDIGVETRGVVAGLKRLHDTDSLPGQKVVIVANMEKAELFGVESNGMVLAAGEEADLLTTHDDASPGTRVH